MGESTLPICTYSYNYNNFSNKKLYKNRNYGIFIIFLSIIVVTIIYLILFKSK